MIIRGIIRALAGICITFGAIATVVSTLAWLLNDEFLQLELILGVLGLIIGIGIEALQKEDIPPPIQFRPTR